MVHIRTQIKNGVRNCCEVNLPAISRTDSFQFHRSVMIESNLDAIKSVLLSAVQRNQSAKLFDHAR